MLNKIRLSVVALFLASNAMAGHHGSSVPEQFPTAQESREVAANSIVGTLQARVQAFAFDGEFEYTHKFETDVPADLREVIQNTFLKAGYRVTWTFNEFTKQLNLTISWR